METRAPRPVGHLVDIGSEISHDVLVPTQVEADRVGDVRAFNRFITQRFGILERGLLGTNHSQTEARVLYELAQHEETETSRLLELLGLDSGYLSRLLSRLEAEGLVAREASTVDARRRSIRLTPAGRRAFAELDKRSGEQVGQILAGLDEEQQRRLVGGMNAVRGVLSGDADGAPLSLRKLRPGDLGWMVARHGVLYEREFGWNEDFEALAARIVAHFGEARDPRSAEGWIAETAGRPVGCLLCARRDQTTAQLRLLLVEPEARGLGVGAMLVDECLGFARRAGYEAIVLWTNDVLRAARKIYERAGFELTEEEPHHSFGHDLVGQYWQLSLKQ